MIALFVSVFLYAQINDEADDALNFTFLTTHIATPDMTHTLTG
jgi:hypothetical protein